jgi:hypothetical protein
MNIEKLENGIRFHDQDWNFSFELLMTGYQIVSFDGFVDVELRNEIISFDTKDISIDGQFYDNVLDWIQALYA